MLKSERLITGRLNALYSTSYSTLSLTCWLRFIVFRSVQIYNFIFEPYWNVLSWAKSFGIFINNDSIFGDLRSALCRYIRIHALIQHCDNLILTVIVRFLLFATSKRNSGCVECWRATFVVGFELTNLLVHSVHWNLLCLSHELWGMSDFVLGLFSWENSLSQILYLEWWYEFFLFNSPRIFGVNSIVSNLWAIALYLVLLDSTHFFIVVWVG